MMMVQREVRIIPRGWKHPTNGAYPTGKTRYIGLCSRDMLQYVDDDDEPLGESDLMPDVAGMAEEETEIAAYETVSEGTPISPSFPNTPEGRFEMVRWLAENADIIGRKVDGETWAAILFGRGAMFDIREQRIVVMGPAS